MSKYKKWDMLEITWHDSYMVHGWTHVENIGLDDDISLDHRSIGYYLGETPRQITICQSSKTNEELIYEPETNVCGVFTIPKRAIVKVNDLKLKGPEAKTKGNSKSPISPNLPERKV